MGKLSCSSKADESYPAGANLASAQTFNVGSVGDDLAFVLTGDGSTDLSAPAQCYVKFTNVTGAQTIDLNDLDRPGGGTFDLARVREITIQNLSTTATHVITVGAAGTTPFVGPFGGTTPTIKVEAGETKTIACKPYGTGYATAGANNLKLDFGANTFSAAVIIKGSE